MYEGIVCETEWLVLSIFVSQQSNVDSHYLSLGILKDEITFVVKTSFLCIANGFEMDLHRCSLTPK